MLKLTNYHYAGRPVFKDSYGKYFYMASKHKKYDTAYKKNYKKYTNPALINKYQDWYVRIYELPKDKQRDLRNKNA